MPGVGAASAVFLDPLASPPPRISPGGGSDLVVTVCTRKVEGASAADAPAAADTSGVAVSCVDAPPCRGCCFSCSSGGGREARSTEGSLLVSATGVAAATVVELEDAEARSAFVELRDTGAAHAASNQNSSADSCRVRRLCDCGSSGGGDGAASIANAGGTSACAADPLRADLGGIEDREERELTQQRKWKGTRWMCGMCAHVGMRR